MAPRTGVIAETADGRADLFEFFDLLELIESTDRSGRRRVPGDLPGVTAVLESTVVDVARKLGNWVSDAGPDPGRAQCDLGLADQGSICAIDDELGRAHPQGRLIRGDHGFYSDVGV